jgi:hypothetical protein
MPRLFRRCYLNEKLEQSGLLILINW